MTTTISDDRKKNAAEALGTVRAFHKAQDNWNRLNRIKAPDELRRPAWADLWATRKAMDDALQLDIGERTEKLSGSTDVLLVGINGQLTDRKLLSFNDRLIFTETLRTIESELRKVAGIKERSFADVVAEKVVQRGSGRLSDGLAPPNRLVWKGTVHELSPQLWRLLDFMWDRDRATLQELEGAVWDGDPIQSNTVSATVSKLNRRLLTIGCPVTLSVKSGYITKT